MLLLIDSYDSFTNNLARLLADSTGKEVVTIHNDTFQPHEYEDFYSDVLPLFEYVVVGPGPGHPAIPKDVGVIGWLLQQCSLRQPVPVLGICLGFQALCHAFGNEVLRLTDVKHGQIYPILPLEKAVGPESLYRSSASFPSVRYHSLFVGIDLLSPEILPLAVCHEGPVKVLMAAKHILLPLYGVQYHPESICLDQGDELVRNFDAIASSFNHQHRKEVYGEKTPEKAALLESIKAKRAVHETYLVQNGVLTCKNTPVHAQKLVLDADSMGIADYLHRQKTPFVLLNSASIPGLWLIIGLPTSGRSQTLTHSTDTPNVVQILVLGNDTSKTHTLGPEDSVWTYLGAEMARTYVLPELVALLLGAGFHSRPLPFVGGFLGLFSYEEGQFVDHTRLKPLTTGPTPDTKLVFVERVLLHDHVSGHWFVVSIQPDDKPWVDAFSAELQQKPLKLDPNAVKTSVQDLCRGNDTILFDFPLHETYQAQFDRCQELLHAGDSYELCLTTQLKLTLPAYIEPWDIYKVLTVHKNPLPYLCFMDFGDVALVLSSPERFLQWRTTENGKKAVQLRPIKGTVRRTPDVDLAAASKILKTPKEMGENLMIVDLIRHDLHQFLPKVNVSQLMAVEQYETVYQLVSAIDGELPTSGFHGVDILHRSLPPGSMTGAPKKRSVQLLQEIESMQKNGNPGGRRGVYSGVVGYWSVTDDADWLVVIRSTYHYRNDVENTATSHLWRIGAGGAITVLSDSEGEWDELRIKLSSALLAFQ